MYPLLKYILSEILWHLQSDVKRKVCELIEDKKVIKDKEDNSFFDKKLYRSID